MMWNTLTPVFIIFIGFYSIGHSSDCQGRPGRITFEVVLDVRSFLTRQEDGLSTGHQRTDVTFMLYITSLHTHRIQKDPSLQSLDSSVIPASC